VLLCNYKPNPLTALQTRKSALILSAVWCQGFCCPSRDDPLAILDAMKYHPELLIRVRLLPGRVGAPRIAENMQRRRDTAWSTTRTRVTPRDVEWSADFHAGISFVQEYGESTASSPFLIHE
jgi:hypothetical protein